MIRYEVVQIPPLHKNQKVIWNAYYSGKYRNLVINAGRRFGKSKCCLSIAIEEAVNRGKKVWWVAPTYKLLGNQWRAAKDVLSDIYSNKSENDKRMEFYYSMPDGTQMRGELNFRSADKPDNLRGDGIDLLIIDEAAFQSFEVYKVLRPATVDTKGKIIFISTPNGHNWFYTLFQRGLPENHLKFPKWWSKHYTSYDNPLLDYQELEDAKEDLTETEFRVEHMAEFIDDIGKVFTNIYDSAKVSFGDFPQLGCVYSVGIDLARKHDATVLSIIDVNTAKQVYAVRFIGEDWDLQKKKLARIIELWRPKFIYADATAVGQPVVEDLQKIVSYPITPFILTPQSKPPLIQSLAVKFQNKELQILDDKSRFGKIQIAELQAYEVKQAKNGLNWQYGAPKGGKDDTVIALALASMPIMGKRNIVKVIENPFFKSSTSRSSEAHKEKRMSQYAQKSHELKLALLKSKGLI